MTKRTELGFKYNHNIPIVIVFVIAELQWEIAFLK